ncbi:T9SS type A sorting domain-containing protein, partial [bacterium]|nr:T9SS type A sorting domain-containing protein [bacterium]
LLALSAYPNPFRGESTLRLALPQAGRVDVTVHAVTGALVRRVRSGWLPDGTTSVHWDGTDERGSAVSPGVYFYRVATPSGTGTERVVRLR